VSAAEWAAALQVALQFQLTAFSRENRLKYAVFCAKRGENLASNTETGTVVHQADHRHRRRLFPA
jgi:hypothetical protein